MSQRTTNSLVANYSLLSSVGGTVLGGGQLNQRLTPNDLTFGTKGFELVGNADVTGTTLVVQLSDLANGRVYADAIRIERVGNDQAATIPWSTAKKTGDIWA